MNTEPRPPSSAAPEAAPTTQPRPSRRKRIARSAVEVAIILALFFGVRAWQTRKTISGPAPQLSGLALDGRELSLASAKGEPVLVHFWATWCGVCRAEEDNVVRLARSHRTITVATSSGDAAKVRAYQQQRDAPMPTLLDPEGDLAREWGVSAFPTSFVIGPDGEVKFVEVGYTTQLGMAFRLWLARVL